MSVRREIDPFSESVGAKGILARRFGTAQIATVAVGRRLGWRYLCGLIFTSRS